MSYFNNHNHDDWSNPSLGFPDVLCSTEELIQRAYDIGLRGISITNHESLSGVVNALNYYKKQMTIEKPFTLAIGNEIYLQTEEEYLKTKDNIAKIPYYHFVLTALDTEGFRQLCQLSTNAWIRGYKRNIWRRPTTTEDLIKYIKSNQGHIIASSACLGSRIDKLLMDDEYDKAKEEVFLMVSIFGEGNFFLEVQPSEYEDTEQSKVNRLILKLSQDTGVPIIPTTDTHYLKKEDREAHAVYLNSGDGDRELDSFYATTYLMDEKELKQHLLIDFTEQQIDEMFNNSLTIPNRVKEYDIFHNPIIPQIPIEKIPCFKHKSNFFNINLNDYPSLKFYSQTQDYHEQYFYYQLKVGFKKHILNTDKAKDKLLYIQRIETELTELKKMSEALDTSMVCYYSTMSAMIDIMWNCDSIVGPGRGSSAAFVITYLLDITAIDPLPLGEYMPHWRHMSFERGAEIADIDTDSEPSKKYAIINAMKDFFGEDKVLNVATFSKVSSKTALEKACRGMGISSDIANYMKSLIPVNRGKTASLSDCFFGNKEKGIKKNYDLIHEVEQYNGLKEVALKIEGTLTNRGVHAAGLAICNEPYLNYTSAMRSPEGVMETSMNLWDSEEVSLVKFDLLTVSAVQKIHRAMTEMLKHGAIEWQGSLKATYEKYLHPDVLDYTTPEMWEQAPDMYGLFQWDTPISTKTLALIKPKSIMDMSAGNSLLRLMPDGIDEPPVEKYIRYKENPNEWEQDATVYGLTEDEKQVIREICGDSYYLAESQEKIMRLAMSPKVAGYTLKESNKLRKAIAKKNEKLQAESKAQFFEWGKKRGTRDVFLKYIWEELFSASMGYSFSSIHSYAYSIIALQELNIYYHYGPVYWNIGCLSTEAVGDSEGSGNGTDYGAMSKAIYKMKAHNVDILPPSVNNAEVDFGCDPKEQCIYFGLGAIASINQDIANQIIQNRPYNSFKDFYLKNSYNGSLITNSKFIQLIKAGCFDEFEPNRVRVMKQYVILSTEPKKSLTMNNLPEAIRIGAKPPKSLLAPYNFKKYVTSKQFFYDNHPSFKTKKLYWLNEKAMKYFNTNCRAQLREGVDWYEEGEKTLIVDKSLDKLFKPVTEELKKYINTDTFIKEFNKCSYRKKYEEMIEVEDVNKWGFEACAYYPYGGHELANLDFDRYNISHFADLPEEPVFVEKSWGKRTWRQYDISAICGVVLSRNDNNHLVSILTPENEVVNIKFNGGTYAHYKQQISEQSSNGKKTIMDKSWFERGSLIIVSGYRRGESDFAAKKYKNSIFSHQVQKIDRVNDNGEADIRSARYGFEEDE